MADAADATNATGIAKTAAERAGVVVTELTELHTVRAACALFGDLWRAPNGVLPISDHVLHAFQLSGNYVFGAFDQDGELTGASVAWATPPPKIELHSHVTGIQARHHHGGIGLALKLHQRAWALERELDTITWTFDPLVRRNALFNLNRLGAEVTCYIENAYGEMDDALNAGDESDRLLVRWHLGSDRTLAAIVGTPPVLGGDRPLALVATPDGKPLVEHLATNSPEVTVQVPADIESLRISDPAAARGWRAATSAVLGARLNSGGRVLGLDWTGAYVVSASRRSPSEEEPDR